eukprot:7422501-Prorocentrum_lima.AAC.1
MIKQTQAPASIFSTSERAAQSRGDCSTSLGSQRNGNRTWGKNLLEKLVSTLHQRQEQLSH